MGLALVVMAAGMGSRFGGNKQLVPVGPRGEVFFDFAVEDSLAAGADRVVMIVRRAFADEVEQHIRGRYGADLDLQIVCQDEADAPPRAKPWGTAHAVLSAAGAIDRPFIVVNADDYYGVTAYAAVARVLEGITPDRAVVAGFSVGNTMPAQGAVSRGVCEVADGRLTTIVETHGIERRDGVIVSADPPGTLPADQPVSMNMWGFHPSLLGHLATLWQEFLAARGHEEKSEYLLPGAVGELMARGVLAVQVVPTDESWIGVTNPDDLEPATTRLAELRA
jgi:CTP:molybdopterin cytidylyltransferase MocA